ncbi:hypothetical protein MHYP_G00029330 [Metynnis hypsauchen]
MATGSSLASSRLQMCGGSSVADMYTKSASEGSSICGVLTDGAPARRAQAQGGTQAKCGPKAGQVLAGCWPPLLSLAHWVARTGELLRALGRGSRAGRE